MTNKKFKLAAMSLATAVAVSTVGPSASAVTYYLGDGSVTVDKDEERGAYSYQGEDGSEKHRTYVNEDKAETGDGTIYVQDGHAPTTDNSNNGTEVPTPTDNDTQSTDASGNNTEMVYCIRGADIPEVRAGNKGKMPTRYILPKNYAAKQLVDGDIVVEISGGSPTQSTGRAAAVSDALLARYDKGMVCTNFCKALKPRAGYSMYVYYYWQYLYDRDIFFSYENGTTGIKNLDINGFIETEPIVIAPEDLVEKFDAVCQTVFSKIYANGMENEQLALVRDTILPKLMSGEIDVSAVQL